ncbi:MAG: serine hydroxymethyltransferase [Firmicutes bacterium]|nr:serine hydroxymethyltransferase [Bacillota bacterium]
MDYQALLNQYIDLEKKRQDEGLELIASENYTSSQVMAIQGSILTNKYAEGFPGKRYYGGCVHVDKIEQLAIDLACQLYACKFANVQPHSGSSANFIVYSALLKPGDKIMSLGLNEGGHLTHGSSVNFSGKLYQFIHYVLKADGRIDYVGMQEMARKEKPKLIVAGFSSYPYLTDYEKFSTVAKEIGAIFMVDMAHISGLVAAGVHPSPFPYADVVTSTTHKTIRGPRGGMILSNNEDYMKKINSATFPGAQGGPLVHVIGGKAQAFAEALEPSFKQYAKQILKNTKACADEFAKLGAKVSGTETHLFLVDTKYSFGLTGYDCQVKLDEIGVTLNKNMLPNDQEKPQVTSGVRIGFAALTTRGVTEDIARDIARLIYRYLKGEIQKDLAESIVKRTVSLLKPIQNI